MARLDQLVHILAVLDEHFAADDVSPADVDRWHELSGHLVRMLDGLDLARIELENLVEGGAPQTKEIVRQALQYVRFGLGEKTGGWAGLSYDASKALVSQSAAACGPQTHRPVARAGVVGVASQALSTSATGNTRSATGFAPASKSTRSDRKLAR